MISSKCIIVNSVQNIKKDTNKVSKRHHMRILLQSHQAELDLCIKLKIQLQCKILWYDEMNEEQNRMIASLNLKFQNVYNIVKQYKTTSSRKEVPALSKKKDLESQHRNSSNKLYQQSNLISLNLLKSQIISTQKNIHMQYTDEQFGHVMKQLHFRKNQIFKSKRKNLQRVVQFLETMEIDEKAFEIVEYLIKEFGISILLCFEPFYQKITKNHKARAEFKQKLQRISSLVNCHVKPYKCGQLRFFAIEGKSKKLFSVKQKTWQQLALINELQFFRNCIIKKKQHPQMQKIPKDQVQKIKEINKEIKDKKFNPFATYYIKGMLRKVLNQYNLEKIEGSTTDETQEERLERENDDYFQKQKTTEGIGTVVGKNNMITGTVRIGQAVSKKDEFIGGRKQILQINKQQFKVTTSQQQKLPSTSSSLNNSYGPNFSAIPLCCRSYFFDQQRILLGQDKRTQYKSYRFPFNPPSIQTFKKTICAFLNTIGGEIYIGIKQTTNRKYRYVLGNYLTENDKEEVLKSFRKISEAIYPNVSQQLQVEFVPVRKTPFPDISLLGHIQTYFYDFSKKTFELDKCPYRPARYVIRVRVPMGNREWMYSYRETEYQLNKNSASQEFIPLRAQNQVLVKQISQQVLRQYKKKLLYGQEQKVQAVHVGSCIKPELGDPRNQPQPQDQVMDAKDIEVVFYNQMMAKKKGFGQEAKGEGGLVISKDTYGQTFPKIQNYYNTSKEQKFTLPSRQPSLVSQQQLTKIYQYPLNFIVTRISHQRLTRCIVKTPAHAYTLIKTQKNQLNPNEDLLLINVDAYSHMEQFLRVKEQIQKHFAKDGVQFLGVSKVIKLENSQNRRVAEELLAKNKNKYIINGRNLEFYSLLVAASYFLYMRHMGFRMLAVRQ